MSKSFKLNYVHLCSYASVDKNGNVNILGIFDQINSPNYPTGLVKMVLAMSLQPTNPTEKEYELKILSVGPDGKKGEPSALKISYNGEGKNLNILADIINPIFKTPGEYRIEIYIENEEIATVSLQAKVNE
jgi:hypothetical protein